MKELSNTNKGERIELISSLSMEAAAIEEAVNAVNEKVDALNEKISAYNNTLKNAKDWRDGIVQNMQDHFAGTSEKWQESEAGNQYSDWVASWEAAELEPLETLEKLSPIEPDHHRVLEELPEFPE